MAELVNYKVKDDLQGKDMEKNNEKAAEKVMEERKVRQVYNIVYLLQPYLVLLPSRYNILYAAARHIMCQLREV